MVAYFSADALRPCSESQPTAPVQKKENYLSQKSANVKTHRILLGTAIGKEKAEKGKKGEASLGAEAQKNYHHQTSPAVAKKSSKRGIFSDVPRAI